MSQLCHLLFSQPRMSAFYKGQLIEVTCTWTPSEAVSSAVHNVLKQVRTSLAEETVWDCTRQ